MVTVTKFSDIYLQSCGKRAGNLDKFILFLVLDISMHYLSCLPLRSLEIQIDCLFVCFTEKEQECVSAVGREKERESRADSPPSVEPKAGYDLRTLAQS